MVAELLIRFKSHWCLSTNLADVRGPTVYRSLSLPPALLTGWVGKFVYMCASICDVLITEDGILNVLNALQP